MKSPATLFFCVIFPILYSAQHQTKFNSNGDALTEIVDANSMKQGDWIYYDYSNKIVRIETYQNHELKSSVVLIDKKPLNTLEYFVDFGFKNRLSKSDFYKNKTSFSGEVVIDNNGAILQVVFYTIQDITQIEAITLDLKAFILNNTNSLQNVILIF